MRGVRGRGDRRRLACVRARALVLSGVVAISTLLACGVATSHGQPTVARHTTVAGKKTASVDVYLPRAVRPFASSSLLGGTEEGVEYSFEGGGEYVGAALRAEGPFAETHRPTFEVHREGPRSHGASGPREIPAGPYRLYFIGDAGGKVHLRFPSLDDGTLVVTPERPAPFWAGPLPQRPSSPDTTVFGRTDEVSPAGFEYVLIATESYSESGQKVEICRYDGGDEHAGSSAYTSGCPGGTSHGTATQGISVRYTGDTPRRRGWGGNVTWHGSSRVGIKTFGLWFSYAEAPLPTGSPPAPAAAATVRIAASRIRVRRGRALVPLVCVDRPSCRGRVALRGGRGVRFSLRGPRAKRIRVPVPRKLRRRLRRKRVVGATIRVRTSTGQTVKVANQPVKLVRSDRRRRR